MCDGIRDGLQLGWELGFCIGTYVPYALALTFDPGAILDYNIFRWDRW